MEKIYNKKINRVKEEISKYNKILEGELSEKKRDYPFINKILVKLATLESDLDLLLELLDIYNN